MRTGPDQRRGSLVNLKRRDDDDVSFKLMVIRDLPFFCHSSVRVTRVLICVGVCVWMGVKVAMLVMMTLWIGMAFALAGRL